MVFSLVDLQEGQLIPQYYYVSSSNKHINKMDEEWMIIFPYNSGFASDSRTISKFTIDCS